MPRGYDGNAANYQGFLQLNLYLATVQPAPSNHEKVFALVSCLTGKALESASTVCGGEDAALDHFEEFTQFSTTHLRAERQVNVSII